MKERKYLLILFLILVLAFSLRIYPLIENSYNSEPDSFFHIRMTENIISQGNIPREDNLSMGGRINSYLPIFHVSIAIVSLISNLPVDLMAPLYAIVSGCFSILLVYIASKKIFKSEKHAIISALFLATMGLHLVRTSTNVRPDNLGITIILASFVFLRDNKKIPFFVTVIFLSLLNNSSWIYFSVIFLFIAIICFLLKKDFPTNIVIIGIMLGYLFYLYWITSRGLEILNITQNFVFQSSEMQSPSLLFLLYLFSSTWIFIIYGILNSKNIFIEKIWLYLGFFIGSFAVRYLVFLAPMLAIFSSIGFYYILNKVEKYRILFLIFFVALIFLNIFGILKDVEQYPSEQNKNALLWLRNNSDRNSIVGSVWDNGHLITQIARRKTVIDGYFEFVVDLEERNSSIEKIASSSKCGTIEAEIKKYKINYFFITDYLADTVKYKAGILESDCVFIELLFDNGAKIIKFKQ